MERHARAEDLGILDDKGTKEGIWFNHRLVSDDCMVLWDLGEAQVPQGNSPVTQRIGMATPQWQSCTHESKSRTVRGNTAERPVANLNFSG